MGNCCESKTIPDKILSNNCHSAAGGTNNGKLQQKSYKLIRQDKRET